MQASAGILNTLKKVDQSKTFQGFVIFVIIVSALSIGAHTYQLTTAWLEQQPIWALGYRHYRRFSWFELIIRFMASDGTKVISFPKVGISSIPLL